MHLLMENEDCWKRRKWTAHPLITNWFIERVKWHFQVTYENIPISRRLLADLQQYPPKILVLDMDETLVHSCSEVLTKGSLLKELTADFVFCISANGIDSRIEVFKRPYVDHFLDMISQWYILVIFTAATEAYANPIIDQLDRNRGILNERLYRRHCQPTNVSLTKDLRIICKDLSRICIIDNSPTAYLFYPENAIPINEWTGNRNDTALLDLLPFLDCLRFCADVRSVLRRGSENRSIIPVERRKSASAMER
uniref:FCP1 homology domain-containing protein n=1 Tax=Trichuris muris TaxID=70415 RepID=A0A5S6QPS3_TRIMR